MTLSVWMSVSLRRPVEVLRLKDAWWPVSPQTEACAYVFGLAHGAESSELLTPCLSWRRWRGKVTGRERGNDRGNNLRLFF